MGDPRVWFQNSLQTGDGGLPLQEAIFCNHNDAMNIDVDAQTLVGRSDGGRGKATCIKVQSPLFLQGGVLGSSGGTGGGEPGPAGPPGPEGPPGPTGPASTVPGPPGATGADGEQGIQGPAGPAGAQGVKGDTGAQGSQGPQGIPGATGATGPAGPTGPTGPQGAAGTGINVKGQVPTVGDLPMTGNADGDAYIVVETGDMWIWDTETGAYINAGPIQGPAGPEGPQGIQGPQGVQGVAGPEGPQGDTGATGATGATGPQGPIGATGATGAEGPQGDIGPQGGQGIQGVPGATGPEGPEGPQGDPGPQGVQGPAGATGSIGPQGPAGADSTVPGPPGATGATGPEGPQGMPGVAGPEGPQGDPGATGATGAQGIPGATGPQGATGTTGAQGPKGDTGTAGAQGPAGATGAQGIPGTAGEAWFSGTANPTTVAGAISGDWFLNTTTGDVFELVGAVWTPRGNIRGPQGIQGIQGPTGATGTQGPQGVKGDTGNTGATGTQGPQGIQGVPGATGSQGIQGPAGPGLPAGGTTGQFPRKSSATDYATAWYTLTKTDVGLGNVDNTTDLGKPISTATQTALNGKLSLSGGAMTGALDLQTPTTDWNAVPKNYVDSGLSSAQTQLNGKVAKAGDTMTGNLSFSVNNTGVNFAGGARIYDSGATATVMLANNAFRVYNLDGSVLMMNITPTVATFIAGLSVGTNAVISGTLAVLGATTLSGNLTISKVNPEIILDKAASGQGNFISSKLNGVFRWQIQLGEATAEGGGDTGSDFYLVSFGDTAGNKAVLRGTRNDGLLRVYADPTAALGIATKQYADLKLPLAGGTITGNLTINGTTTVTTPTAPLHAATKGYVDGFLPRTAGPSYPLTGNLYVGGSYPGVVLNKAVSGEYNGFYGSLGGLTRWLLRFGDTAAEAAGNVGSDFNLMRYDNAGVYLGGGMHMTRATGVTVFTSDSVYKPNGGPFLAGSDLRIKDVLGEYTSGLEQIMSLRPVRYRYRGNDTMHDPAEDEEEMRSYGAPFKTSAHHTAAVDGAEYVGLVAQEVETKMPECVKQAIGYIDGAKVDDLRSLDSGPIIYALINAVQELEARLRSMENTASPRRS